MEDNKYSTTSAVVFFSLDTRLRTLALEKSSNSDDHGCLPYRQNISQKFRLKVK